MSFLAVATFATAALGGGIRCSNGAFEHDCPDSAPVCCFAADGTSAGCCPAGMMCDSNNDCRDAPALPPNSTGIPEHDVSEDVHVSSEHIAMVVSGMVGFLCLTFVVVYLVMMLKRWRLDNEARRQLLETTQSSDSDSEVSSECERTFRNELAGLEHPDDRSEVEPSVLRCQVCHIDAVNCMVQPCQHTVCCHNCATKLKRCCECSKIIKKRKKLFLVA